MLQILYKSLENVGDYMFGLSQVKRLNEARVVVAEYLEDERFWEKVHPRAFFSFYDPDAIRQDVSLFHRVGCEKHD